VSSVYLSSLDRLGPESYVVRVELLLPIIFEKIRLSTLIRRLQYQPIRLGVFSCSNMPFLIGASLTVILRRPRARWPAGRCADSPHKARSVDRARGIIERRRPSEWHRRLAMHESLEPDGRRPNWTGRPMLDFFFINPLRNAFTCGCDETGNPSARIDFVN